MTKYLAAIVLVEIALAVFLAVLVFGGTVDRVGAAPAHASAAAPSEASAAATASEYGERSEQHVPRSERTAADVAGKWNPDDPVGVLLHGTVSWADGTSVERPQVSLSAGAHARTADATGDGRYAAAGLRPGEHELTVRAPHAADLTRSVSVGDDAVQRLDVMLQRSFPVRVLLVTPGGQDAVSALGRGAPGVRGDLYVAAQAAPLPAQFAPNDSGAVPIGDAVWTRESNPKNGFAGMLHLAAPPPAHAALMLRHVVIAQQRIEAGQSELRFVVDPDAVRALAGSIAVRVIDAVTATPLANARVTVTTAEAGAPGQPVGADGRTTVELVWPGLVHYRITAPDHEHLEAMLRVGPAQRVDLGDVRLGPHLPLPGRVVDADGRPCGATVNWNGLEGRTSPKPFTTTRLTRCEADGTFSIVGAGRGRIAVTARTQDGRIAAGVFDNPPRAPVELRLSPASRLEVRRTKDPTKAYVLTLFDAGRSPIAAFPIDAARRSTHVSMPPGEYTFAVHDEDAREVQRGSLTLGEAPAVLEIR